MKSKLFLIIPLLAGLISFSSCEEKIPNEMPPETQIGANTLGCIINGKLFIGGYYPRQGHRAISASYYQISEKLYISASGAMENKAAGDIVMIIDAPQKNAMQKFTEADYSPTSDFNPPVGTIGNDIAYCFTFSTVNDGICTITKFDLNEKIVSGRFEFMVGCTFNYNDSTVTIPITQGRFDLKFDIYDN